MNGKASKIPTLTALGLSAVSFALVSAGWIVGRHEPADIPGIGSALWLGSVAAAACAVLVYYHDAVQAVKQAKRGFLPRFNALRAAVLFCGLPMGLYFGLRPGWNILIWNAYQAAMCCFEAAWLMMHPKVDL